MGGVQAVVGAKREHKQSKHRFDRKRACVRVKERERVKVVKVKVQAESKYVWGERSERGGPSSETIRQIVTAPGTKSYTAPTTVRWVK